MHSNIITTLFDFYQSLCKISAQTEVNLLASTDNLPVSDLQAQSYRRLWDPVALQIHPASAATQG